MTLTDGGEAKSSREVCVCVCDGQRVEGKWGAVGPEEVMRSDTMLMQDLDSSHGEVVLSGAAMMTTTQSAGLSAAVVE